MTPSSCLGEDHKEDTDIIGKGISAFSIAVCVCVYVCVWGGGSGTSSVCSPTMHGFGCMYLLRVSYISSLFSTNCHCLMWKKQNEKQRTKCELWYLITCGLLSLWYLPATFPLHSGFWTNRCRGAAFLEYHPDNSMEHSKWFPAPMDFNS